jgi:predicted dehydrogenase
VRGGLRAVLVGAGGIGSAYADAPSGAPRTHAAGLLAHPGVELVGAVDTDRRRREEFLRRRGRPAWTPSQAGRAGRIDVAVVATPPGAHGAGLELALHLGASAVLCEKPLGRTAEEAKAIASRASEAGASLLVNYSRRFDPGFARLGARMEAGAVGDIRRLAVDYCRGLRNNASHALDLARSMVGDLEASAAADRLNEGGDDPSLDVWLRSADGIPVDLTAFPAGAYHTFAVEIVGRDGTVRAEGTTAWLREGPGDALAPLAPARVLVRHLGEGAIAGAIDDLVAAARAQRRPRCGPDEALAVWALLERAVGMAAAEP